MRQDGEYEHLTKYAELSPNPPPVTDSSFPTGNRDDDNPYEYEVEPHDHYLAHQLRLRNMGNVTRLNNQRP